MQIGFNTSPFIDGANMPIEEVLEMVAAQGYAGIDVCATRDDLDDPSLFPQDDRRAYLDTSERLGLEIVGVVTNLPMINAVWEGRSINIPGAVDLALDINAQLVTVHIGTLEGTGNSFDLAWESAVEHLTDVCKYAEEREVFVAIDGIRPNALLDSMEKVLELIRVIGSPILKVNFDPCSLTFAELDPIEVAKELSDLICHVNIKDYKGTYPDHQPHIPGNGKLDHKAWYTALKRIKYKDYVVVDCDKSHDLKKSARTGMRNLRKYIK
ncbi:MAG: sugar phosphate isomerase/epimerase [Planctomycetota bacterium]|nr:sugar phosphate isomerase/epimerase [Planctomycetota bacterium]MDA1138059.1 sugar phosphate isomerase/epimerase [Planctomycetota bacterium]